MPLNFQQSPPPYFDYLSNSPPPSPPLQPPWYDGAYLFENQMIASFSTIAILLLLMALCILCNCRSQNHISIVIEQGQPRNRNRQRLPVLRPERRVNQPRPLRTIAAAARVFQYKIGEKIALEDECVICLEDFKEGDKCKILTRCNHIYHKACVDRWIVNDAHCPICRECVQLRTTNRIPV
ncbi:RING-H2 finger protein ATL66-like [Mercurialis annua]|uniref:RING-H2 finger protein ATL66-like n=1 Tax=Mercurialis annua TaxID=3986 RepID=UPI0021603D79|nr:RING-H2 finger protein ATL66-like [Mercurialis annua]